MQNVGMAESSMDATVAIRSRIEYCFTADSTPRDMPTTMAMPTLKRVRRMVLGQRPITVLITGSL